jgi:hypothetical protein
MTRRTRISMLIAVLCLLGIFLVDSWAGYCAGLPIRIGPSVVIFSAPLVSAGVVILGAWLVYRRGK